MWRMALTASTMLDLGVEAPDFSLPDVTAGGMVSLDDVAKDVFDEGQNKGCLVVLLVLIADFDPGTFNRRLQLL